MEWGWLPALVGIIALAFQLTFQVGQIRGRLDQIDRRLSRLENFMNSSRKEG